MTVYEGVLGEDRGKIILGDADALAYAMEMCGVMPADGYAGVAADFRRWLLEWFYSGNWQIFVDVPSDEVREKWWGFNLEDE